MTLGRAFLVGELNARSVRCEVENCYAKSITYRNVCLLCKAEGIVSEYISESSLSGYERANQHVEAGENTRTTSHIHKHLSEKHPDNPGAARESIGMRVVRTHPTAFTRELHEVVLIKNFKGHLLNSKLQWGNCLVPELTTDMANTKSQIRHNRAKRDRGDNMSETNSKKVRIQPPGVQTCLLYTSPSPRD